jgi:hypothetical protein
MIENTIYRIIDWLTALTDESFDESGQFTPWNIFWSIVFLFLVLAVLRYFGII